MSFCIRLRHVPQKLPINARRFSGGSQSSHTPLNKQASFQQACLSSFEYEHLSYFGLLS